MGAPPQAPQLQLAVDLGISPSDTLVWNPTGLDVFVNLEVPTTDLEIVRTSPSNNIQAGLQFIGDNLVGFQSEPTSKPASRSTKHSQGHLQKPLVNGGSRSWSGNDVWELTCFAGGNDRKEDRSIDGDYNAKVSTDNGRRIIRDCEPSGMKANILSEITDAHRAPTSISNEHTDGSVGQVDNPSSVSAKVPTMFGIEGLEEVDILAACQLLLLGHGHLGEIVDPTLAACRLRELSTCMRTADEEEFEYSLRDDCLRLATSTKVDPSATYLRIPYYKACTTTAGDDLDRENDQWGSFETSENLSSDLRTLKLKRIKPNKGRSDRGCERDDDDWHILDRPPHKRKYKSLREVYYPRPTKS